jgi:Cu+-exporting ATPase
MAMLSVSDRIKPDAAVTVRVLRNLVKEIILLTGDNRVTATAVAKQVNIV